MTYKRVSIEHDEDGWWGYCPDGLQNSDGPSHTFHEDTLAELKQVIRWFVKPCKCESCLAMKENKK